MVFGLLPGYARKTGDTGFLAQDLDGRTLKQVALDMTRSIETGTPTGVKMDQETGLLFSPSHFTWMDTNFPAGSPRQGYPVEIQALWHNALTFLEIIDPGSGWGRKADQVRLSIESLFWNEAQGYFSDCLQGDGPARKALPDDALRPNQLLLFTLGVMPPGEKARKTVETCLELLVPGGIRSLADRELAVPLPVVHDKKCSMIPIIRMPGCTRAMRIPKENRPITTARPGPGRFPYFAKPGQRCMVSPATPPAWPGWAA